MGGNTFLRIYEVLYEHYGPQQWWPADSLLEMIVGSVLTQNTNWNNVEKALGNITRAELMSIERLLALTNEELAQLIRPAGYYNIKAKRLKNLLHMIDKEYDGRLQRLLDDELYSCREKLLQVKGVGEETADAILLYGCGHPIFVVDSYTHRIFSRHNLVEEESYYGAIQECFMEKLPADAELFNEYHALIVRLAKDFCKKNNPLCDTCPLKGI